MAWLIMGLVTLIGMHLVPASPSLRRQLVQRLGEMPYRGIFALVSLAGFTLIVIGMGKASFIPVWEPPQWGYTVVPVFMLPAFILLVAAYLPGNVHRFTPHPMLWGVVLWAAGHLLANGDLASIVLFGALGLYSVFAMWSANRRGAARTTDRVSPKRDIIVVAVGLGLYIATVFLHPFLFGVAAIPVS